MSEEKIYYTYITASKRNGTLYVGITSNVKRRIYEHKNGLIDGFTKKYKVDKLVYFETTNDIASAIQREKQIKKWDRKWKIEKEESAGFEAWSIKKIINIPEKDKKHFIPAILENKFIKIFYKIQKLI